MGAHSVKTPFEDELKYLQRALCVLAGMAELLKQSAENGQKPETAYIADSLGVMKEHIDSRADRLDAALRS